MNYSARTFFKKTSPNGCSHFSKRKSSHCTRKNISMCGIASVVVADPAEYDLDSVAERMQARLLHRGPDDRGRFVSPRRHCALAHTRLSILDLSNAGHQPISTPDGRYTIVLNGEIYNYRELRRELEQDGVDFRSHTDTEVVLNLFARNGVKCLRRLRG